MAFAVPCIAHEYIERPQRVHAYQYHREYVHFKEDKVCFPTACTVFETPEAAVGFEDKLPKQVIALFFTYDSHKVGIWCSGPMNWPTMEIPDGYWIVVKGPLEDAYEGENVFVYSPDQFARRYEQK